MSLDQIYEGPAGAAPGERQGPSAREALDQQRRDAQKTTPVAEVPSLSDVQQQILDDVKTGTIPSGRVGRGAFELEQVDEPDVPFRLSGTQVKGGTRTPHAIGSGALSGYELETDRGAQQIYDISDIVPGQGVLFQVSDGSGDTREVFVPQRDLRGALRTDREEIDRMRADAYRQQARTSFADSLAAAQRGRQEGIERARQRAQELPPPSIEEDDVVDALDYAVDDGPYKDQEHIVSNEDIYRASDIDYGNLVDDNGEPRQGVTEASSGNRNGMDWVIYEDEDGNQSSFVFAPEGVVNVTGNTAYGPEKSVVRSATGI